jgi:hypothetical protein
LTQIIEQFVIFSILAWLGNHKQAGWAASVDLGQATEFLRLHFPVSEFYLSDRAARGTELLGHLDLALANSPPEFPEVLTE